MSMTREEAIKYAEFRESRLEVQLWENDCAYGNYAMYSTELSFIKAALAALRPVSRERVELYTNRLWPGCPRCSMTKDEAFDAGGAHEFRALGDSLYYCDSNYGWEGEKIGYCPWCGKPLGKATELKHIEKLEVLLND